MYVSYSLIKTMTNKGIIYKHVGRVEEIRDGAPSQCRPQQEASATLGLKVRKLEQLLAP